MHIPPAGSLITKMKLAVHGRRIPAKPQTGVSFDDRMVLIQEILPPTSFVPILGCNRIFFYIGYLLPSNARYGIKVFDPDSSKF